MITRPAIAEDRDFIVSGWSSSYRASHDCTTPRTLYAKQKHEEIAFYLERARVLVGHGESGVLFGFIAYDPTVYVARIGRTPVTLDGYVLYVYVAEPFRRRGFGRQLFAAADISPYQRFGYLCRTRWSRDLRSKVPLAQHEPFRARYEEITHGRSSSSAEAGPEGRAPEGGSSEGPRADPRPQDLVPRGDRSTRRQ